MARQIGMLDDARIARRRGLQFCGLRQRRVDLLGNADAAGAGSELPDEVRFGLEYLPAVAVEAPLGDVTVDLDLFVRCV